MCGLEAPLLEFSEKVRLAGHAARSAASIPAPDLVRDSGFIAGRSGALDAVGFLASILSGRTATGGRSSSHWFDRHSHCRLVCLPSLAALLVVSRPPGFADPYTFDLGRNSSPLRPASGLGHSDGRRSRWLAKAGVSSYWATGVVYWRLFPSDFSAPKSRRSFKRCSWPTDCLSDRGEEGMLACRCGVIESLSSEPTWCPL